MTDRKEILLKAAFDILKKCNDSYYVTSPMTVTAFYDDIENDGYGLMQDIADELDLSGEDF